MNVSIKSRVLIGMPVWNCKDTVTLAIESILRQEFQNWELLISDNASTDGTFEICQEFKIRDCRIRLVRQDENIGGWPNFFFVSNCKGYDYFKFHAADDQISANFLSLSVAELDQQHSLSGVCAMDFWDYEVGQPESHRSFSLVGTPKERLLTLRSNCWKSNGVFYGVYRSSLVDEILTQDFIKSGIHILDWLFIAIMAKKGEILRITEAKLQMGSKGASNSGGDTWFNQLCGVRKLLPYLGFASLYRKSSPSESFRLRLIIRTWLFELYVNHYRGLARLITRNLAQVWGHKA